MYKIDTSIIILVNSILIKSINDKRDDNILVYNNGVYHYVMHYYKEDYKIFNTIIDQK